MLYSCMLALKYYIYIYALLVFYSCFTSLDICTCCNRGAEERWSMACCSRGQLVKHRYMNHHVTLLMHIGAAQAHTRLQERQRVSRAAQVRDACCSRVI